MLVKLLSKFKPRHNIIKRHCSQKPISFFQNRLHKRQPLFPKPKYGGSQHVTLICGKEKPSVEGQEYIKEIFNVCNAPIVFEDVILDTEVENHDKVMDEIILSITRNRFALLTSLEMLNAENQTQRVRLAGSLELFASVMKFYAFPGFSNSGIDCDIVLIGCNIVKTRGLEYEPIKGMVETLRVCEKEKYKTFIEFAYSYAAKYGRRDIIFVHKNEFFQLSDGIFLKLARKIGKFYPHIKIHFTPINELALNLILRPRHFDTVCCHDMFTNLVASILAGICGGTGLFSCSNIGSHHAMFQPVENRLSLPVCEMDEMSPYSLIGACVQLLLHMGYCDLAMRLWKALINTMIKDKIKTEAFCGTSKATDVYCQVLLYLEKYRITK